MGVTAPLHTFLILRELYCSHGHQLKTYVGTDTHIDEQYTYTIYAINLITSTRNGARVHTLQCYTHWINQVT